MAAHDHLGVFAKQAEDAERYIKINGRNWRRSDPDLEESKRQELVNGLMLARRDVAKALKAKKEEDLRDARARVHEAKLGLGERGKPWWE